MTDYYPLVAKAVAGLNAQDRRMLYGRGRDALIAELRAVIPPLSEWVTTKERLAFEEAIRMVEDEAAHRAPCCGIAVHSHRRRRPDRIGGSSRALGNWRPNRPSRHKPERGAGERSALAALPT
jgi:hypothetical protein